MSSSASSESEQRPTQGLVAGKYEIVRLIGRGGMGSVWEARHVSLNTRVAIKFVECEESKNSEARDRFQNEARAAATIQSKHAIKIYDHGLLDDGRPYIVMEMLVGEPLDSRIALLGRLPIQETARLVMQVARALQQAHDAGITHRDLKPENIFLVRNADDDEETAKVLDFGIAKLTDPAHALGVSSSTKTGVLMGTPYFMSPEQARGLKTVDFRSDLWALGVIVFRCVTGSLPFMGEALGDLLVKICASPIPAPSSYAPDVSPQFDAWMMRALQREPGDRYQSALEMADALAMVAGISVRLPSRRSYDPTVGAGLPRVTTPGDATGHADTQAVVSPSPANMMTPPLVTSSPLTSSAPSRQKGFSAAAVTLFAVVGLVAAAGVTATIMTRGRTTAVAVSPPYVLPAAPSSAAGAGSAAPEPTPPPVATVAPATPPEALLPAPLAPLVAPKPASGGSHPSKRAPFPPPPTLPVVAAPMTPPPAAPPPRPVVRPPPPPGNDPGY